MATSRTAWLWWATTRLVLLIVLVTVETGVGFDLKYYRESLGDFGADGVTGTLREYPVPAFLALAAPYALLSLAGATSYYSLFVIVLAVGLDATFLRALLHRAGAADVTTPGTLGGISLPAVVWLAAVPAIGSLTYARFDLLPGVLIGLALLALVDAPRRAAVLGALATGAKYWPALVLPTLAAPRSSRLRVLAAGAVTGAALVVVSLVLGGWDRIMSPLDYQGDRGLQIESVAATPAMVRWAAGPGDHDVFFSKALAWEIDGPGVSALITVSTVATAGLLLAMVALWVLAWRRLGDVRDSLPATIWLTLAAVSAFVVGGKVLSPQYLIWLLPAACAGLALLDDPAEQRRLRRWTAVLLVAAVITHVVFPHGYHELIDHTTWSGAVVALLLVRNLLLVGLCGYALVSATRLVRRPRRRPTDPVATGAS
ncbi:MAG: glycosyltransferase 87 family protein [Propionibacteriales bacterium]|nr:glycosyltransferase 87 family protein [Propionibacteriales bacterium]